MWAVLDTLLKVQQVTQNFGRSDPCRPNPLSQYLLELGALFQIKLSNKVSLCLRHPSWSTCWDSSCADLVFTGYYWCFEILNMAMQGTCNGHERPRIGVYYRSHPQQNDSSSIPNVTCRTLKLSRSVSNYKSRTVDMHL